LGGPRKRAIRSVQSCDWAMGTAIDLARYTVHRIARSRDPVRGSVRTATGIPRSSDGERHRCRTGYPSPPSGIPICADHAPSIQRWDSSSSPRGTMHGADHGPHRHPEGACDGPITVPLTCEAEHERLRAVYRAPARGIPMASERDTDRSRRVPLGPRTGAFDRPDGIPIGSDVYTDGSREGGCDPPDGIPIGAERESWISRAV
jgi:hypothetical protein